MPFVSAEVAVSVPATSANLGPGFDAFGLAVSRYDEVRAVLTKGGLEITVAGEGSDVVPLDEAHLIVRAMRVAFLQLGEQPSGLRLDCVNRIPHGRGLGSSAAAIVAGIELARGLVSDGREILDDAQALSLAARIEGHPDNVAACLLGGLTIAWTTEGVARATRIETSGIFPVMFIPREESATEVARSALPPTVPHGDAAFNAARSALLVLAMTGRPELLMTATEDRLHQPYRSSSMPASSALVGELRAAGSAAVISGAGSTVLTLASSEAEVGLLADHCPAEWEFVPLSVAGGAVSTDLR